MKNKKRIVRVLALLLVMAILTPLVYKQNTAIFAKSSDELGDDIDDLDEALKELQSQLGDLNSELYTISINIETTQDAIAQTEEEMVQLNEQLEAAEVRAEDQYANMKIRIQYMYENTASNSWITMLSSENFSDFLSRLEYITEIATRDKELMEDYASTLEEIKVCKADLEEKQELLAQQEEELQSQKTLMLAKIDTVNDKIEMTEDEKQDLEKQLEELKKLEEEERKRREQEEKNKTPNPPKNPDSPKEPEKPGKPDPVQPVDPGVGEEELLAALIYCEGGAESYEFQMAVASVVVNRVHSAVYPNNLTDVIYQRGQFSPTWSGRLAIVLQRGLTTDSCRRAAREALAGNVTGPWIGFRYYDGSIEGYRLGRVVFFGHW